MREHAKQSAKPLMTDEASSVWTAWDYGKAFIATVGTIAAGAVGFSFLSHFWTDQSENNVVGLNELVALDLRNSDQLVNADYVSTQIIAEQTVDQDHALPIVNPTRRKLLSTGANITVTPIPPQQVEATAEWNFPAGKYFSGDVKVISMNVAGNNPQPTWLQLNPIIGNYAAEHPWDIQLIDNIAYLACYSSLQIVNVKEYSAPKLLGSYTGLAQATNIHVAGKIAYVSGSTSLFIFDVSNLANPTLLSRYDTLDSTVGIDIINNIVYLANNSLGLKILNVTDPTNPLLLGSFDTPGAAAEVQVIGNVAYVADYFSLQILDVTNPISPTLLGNYNTAYGSNAVQVIDNIAYVPGFGSLQILNVTNLAAPFLLGNSLVGGSSAGTIQIVGSLAYMTSGSSGVQIVNIANRANPFLFASYDTPGNAYSLQVVDNIIYVADGNYGLQVIDLANPILKGTPTIGRVGERYTVQLFARDSLALYATTNVSLTVNQIPRPNNNHLEDYSCFPGQTVTIQLKSDNLFINPKNTFLDLSFTTNKGAASWLSRKIKLTPIASYTMAGPNAICIVNDILYAAGLTDGLKILNVVNPSNPNLIGYYNTPGSAYDVQVVGDVAYVAEQFSGLQIFNVSNPAAPSLLGSYDTPGLAYAVKVNGNIAYVADASSLQIFNVSNPANITLLTSFNYFGFGSPVNLYLLGDIAYVAGYSSGLKILNVLDPANPQLLGGYNSWGIEDIQVIDDIAYIAIVGLGLQILNVENPAIPTLIKNYDELLSAWAVLVVGHTAFVRADVSLHVIDVSNPFAPVLIGRYDPPVSGVYHDVQVIGSTVYVDGSAGLQILDISQWELTMSPTDADVGNYEITVTATDELGGQASDSFQLRVEGPPQFNGTIPLQHVTVGQAYGYFVPSSIVSDPNKDVIQFTATAVGGGTWPSWLTFNGVVAAFAGIPDAPGDVVIQITASDGIALSNAKSQTQFTLSSSYAPQVNLPLTAPASWREGKAFTFVVPTNTFSNLNPAEPLVYSSTLLGGAALPSWLHFDPSTLTFSGNPPLSSANQYVVILTATDSVTGIAVSQSFTLSVTVNLAPALVKPLSQQVAQVTQPFRLTLPADTFVDPNQDALNYTARPTNGRWPSWLRFNSETRTFSGTPSRSDTNTYAAKIFPLTISATDGELSTDMPFSLSVEGDNNWVLLIKYGSPTVSALGALYGAYKLRAILLNRCEQRGYEKLEQRIHLGETGSTIPLSCDPDSVYRIEAKIDRQAPKGCLETSLRFFTSSRRPYPGGDLPTWLMYCPKTHALKVIGEGPDIGDLGKLTIQAKNKAGVLLERFTLHIDDPSRDFNDEQNQNPGRETDIALRSL